MALNKETKLAINEDEATHETDYIYIYIYIYINT